MSGGITGAQAGTLTFMVGCEKEYFEQVKEFLLGMGKNVFHCGGPGTGEIAKVMPVTLIALADLQQYGPWNPDDRSCRGNLPRRKAGDRSQSALFYHVC